MQFGSKLGALRGAPVVVTLSLLAAASASADVLHDWNLMVLGNHTSNSEVEGRAFIGGNLGGPASNWAIGLTPPSAWLGVDTLVVGGNITAGNINLNAGNLRLGGSNSANLNFNGGGSLILDPTVSQQVPAFASQLAGHSSALAGLAANSTLALPNGQPGAATFNANPVGGVAVFNITGSSLFSNGLVQQIDLNVNGAASIVINVTGSSILYNGGNFVGAWNTNFARANVIWNFVDATNIQLDRAFNGALLAPNAHLTNSTNIDGSVFVSSFTQNGEVHLPNYTGVVPAPGAIALLGAAGVLARRRRAA